jgi:NAD(P)-dependent dehydrogenase (short-subunit alcohol dehydrogenase family)
MANHEPGERKGQSRRALLRTAGLASAGVALGVAGGSVLASGNRPASVTVSGRRRFEGKVVLVTGATSGIGRAAAKAFAAEGARVGFCGRREALGKAVEHEIREAGGEATYVRADVLQEDQIRAFVDRVCDGYGRLDVAFNNAGITIERPLHEYTVDEWDRVVQTNLRGVFIAMKYEIPRMLETGGGIILVTSSSNAIATQQRRSAYTASKRGLIGLVQSAALDYAPKRIRINAIVPGTTDTELVRRSAGMENVPEAVWQAAASQWAKSHVPGLQRLATPEEIAAFALSLTSDEHPYLTGASLVIDGGKTAQAG